MELSGLDCEVPRGVCKVADWWEWCYGRLDKDEFALFLSVCWTVWGAWCRGVLERELTSPDETIASACKIHMDLAEVSCASGKGEGAIVATHLTE